VELGFVRILEDVRMELGQELDPRYFPLLVLPILL
jgi:hypothetical protein